MTISKENKEFIAGLIDYYISTASSYKDLARVYSDFTDSLEDTTLGMITGSIYSSFMQIYQNQQVTPSIEDIDEFNQMIKARSSEIKKAILELKPEKETLISNTDTRK